MPLEQAEQFSESGETSPEVMQEALDMGFIPRDQFKGDPDKFIEPEAFLERGKHLMPILRKNNETMRGELSQTKAELTKMRALQEANADSLKAMQEFHAEDVKRKVKLARADAKQELLDARDEGDVDREVEALQVLSKLDNEPEVKAGKSESDPPPDYTQEPDYISWREKNPWLGTDRKRSSLALGIMYELREKGETSVGKTFFDKVDKELDAFLGSRDAESGDSRVEGARHSGGGGGGGTGTKNYADLPSEAKAQCEKQSRRLVGEGRAFTDQKAWRKYYADKYFEE